MRCHVAAWPKTIDEAGEQQIFARKGSFRLGETYSLVLRCSNGTAVVMRMIL